MQHPIKPRHEGRCQHLANDNTGNGKRVLVVEGKPDSSKFHRQHQRRGGNERQERRPGRQPAKPSLDPCDRRPFRQGRHGLPEIVEQNVFNEDDRRRYGHEQQFEGVFQMAFHDSAN